METYTSLALLIGGAVELRYSSSDSSNILQTFSKLFWFFLNKEQSTKTPMVFNA